jgi:hypothetical protein
VQLDDQAVRVTQAKTLAEVTVRDAAVGNAQSVKIGDPIAQVCNRESDNGKAGQGPGLLWGGVQADHDAARMDGHYAGDGVLLLDDQRRPETEDLAIPVLADQNVADRNADVMESKDGRRAVLRG